MKKLFLAAYLALVPGLAIADVLAQVNGLRLEVRREGSAYRYLLKDERNSVRGETPLFDGQGIDFNSFAPLSPVSVAEDISFGISQGTIQVWTDGARLFLSTSNDPASIRVLSSFSGDELKLNLSAKARETPGYEAIANERERRRQARVLQDRQQQTPAAPVDRLFRGDGLFGVR